MREDSSFIGSWWMGFMGFIFLGSSLLLGVLLLERSERKRSGGLRPGNPQKTTTPQPPTAPPAQAPPHRAGNADARITIVELPHNNDSVGGPVDRTVTVERARELLAHAGRVDCPICAKLGFPLVLVPVEGGPSAKVIPTVGGRLHSNNPRNNRFATVMASRVETGLAPGIAIGNAYALRTDFKSFTVAEYARLDDVGLNSVMDAWGDGRPPSAAQYKRIGDNVMYNIKMNPYKG